jgi:hypothetical protein
VQEQPSSKKQKTKHDSSIFSSIQYAGDISTPPTFREENSLLYKKIPSEIQILSFSVNSSLHSSNEDNNPFLEFRFKICERKNENRIR